jgi:hypothetical protein
LIAHLKDCEACKGVVAYHRTLNRRRQLQSTHSYDTVSLDDVLMGDLDAGARLPFRYLPGEVICLVDRALELIQPRQRRAIELIYYEGLTSDYDALQTQFRRRLSRGLQALASYTWSHSIDTASAGSLYGSANALLPSGASQDRGPSDFDLRHTLSAALTYDLPASKEGALKSYFA